MQLCDVEIGDADCTLPAHSVVLAIFSPRLREIFTTAESSATLNGTVNPMANGPVSPMANRTVSPMANGHIGEYSCTRVYGDEHLVVVCQATVRPSKSRSGSETALL